MASELTNRHPTGGLTTLYAVLHQGLNVVKASDGTLVARTSGNWASAKLAAVDTAASTYYVASVPANTPAGRYSVTWYVQAGGAAALSDPDLPGTTVAFDWTGTAVGDAASALASVASAVTGTGRRIYVANAPDADVPGIASDSNDGLSPLTPVTTTYDFVAHCLPGDTIVLLGMVYVFTTVIVPEFCTLEGSGKGRSSGLYSDNTPASPYIRPGYGCTIRNLTVGPSPAADTGGNSRTAIGYIGTEELDLSNVTIEDCLLIGSRDGILINPTSTNAVMFDNWTVTDTVILSDFDTVVAQPGGSGSVDGSIVFRSCRIASRDLVNTATYSGPRAGVGIKLKLYDCDVDITSTRTQTSTVRGWLCEGGTIEFIRGSIKTGATRLASTANDAVRTSGTGTMRDVAHDTAKTTGTIVYANTSINGSGQIATGALADIPATRAAKIDNLTGAVATASGLGDTQSAIAAVQASVDAIDAGAAGPGADQCTIRIETAAHAAIPDADVWVTSDADGQTTVAGTLQTNSQGEVTFLLDAGDTYFLFAQKDGYNLPQGDEFVAVAD